MRCFKHRLFFRKRVQCIVPIYLLKTISISSHAREPFIPVSINGKQYIWQVIVGSHNFYVYYCVATVFQVTLGSHYLIFRCIWFCGPIYLWKTFVFQIIMGSHNVIVLRIFIYSSHISTQYVHVQNISRTQRRINKNTGRVSKLRSRYLILKMYMLYGPIHLWRTTFLNSFPRISYSCTA